MTLKDAHDRAMTWSHSPPRRTAVICATPTELSRPFYWEYHSPAIPPEKIIATYFNGTLEPLESDLMADTADHLTIGEKFIVDWQFHLTGDFCTALAAAIRNADSENLHLLSRAFPEEVAAYRCFSGNAGWWDRTMQKAKNLGYLPRDAR